MAHRKTQFICRHCGSSDVTVFGGRRDEFKGARDAFLTIPKPSTIVRCDDCGYEGDKDGFIRVRFSKKSNSHVRNEVLCNKDGVHYGEIRDLDEERNYLVVTRDGREIWATPDDIKLL